MPTIASPIIDITALNAVESLFRGGPVDPWARQTAGELVDLIVYAERPRFVLPCSASNTSLVLPKLLEVIQAAEPGLFRAQTYSTDEPRQLALQYLEPSFQRFVSWAKANKNTLREWTALHSQNWIRGGHLARVKHGYVYDRAAIPKRMLAAVSSEVDIQEDALCYAFDVILRYPLYGELAGEGERYLNHPIRDSLRLPTMEELDFGQVPIPLSFKASVSNWAPSLTLDEFARVALELRESVKRAGIDKLQSGEFEVQAVRELAGVVGIPPTLKSAGKWGAVAGGLIAGLGAIPALGPTAALVSGSIAVSGALWRGRLPSSTGRVRWLRWATEWPELERQAEHRE